jgi:hypothetical protein
MIYNKKREISWSFLSSFEYDPEQWYKKYVLNEPQPTTPEMLFGKEVGKKLETDPTYLPFVKRHNKMEHCWKVKLNKKVKLVGYADSFCVETNRKLYEFKTGKAMWTQSRADKHGQITMYCLMNYLKNGIKPEEMEIELVWLPTRQKNDGSIIFVQPIEKAVKRFKTKRTMVDIVKFIDYINETLVKMDQYCYNHLH